MQTTTEEKLVKAIKALGVVLKTPHIAAYLASTDPQAVRQCTEAFESASDAIKNV